MSVPQMPHAATLIRTSPSETSGTGTSSTCTIPFSRYTPARMVLGIGPPVFRTSTTVPVRLTPAPPSLASPATCLDAPAPERIVLENPRALPQLFDSAYRTSAGPLCFSDVAAPAPQFGPN